MISEFDVYQNLAARTAREDLYADRRLTVAALGLIGEAAEISEHVKKYLGHGHKLDTDKITSELGDVLWYIAEMCSLLGLELSDVAGANIEKLKARYPEGFSEERSQNR